MSSNRRILSVEEGLKSVRRFLQDSEEEVLMTSLNMVFASSLKKDIRNAINRGIKVKILVAKEYKDRVYELKGIGAEVRLIEGELIHPMRCDVSDSKKANFAVLEPSFWAFQSVDSHLAEFFKDLFDSWWIKADKAF